MTEKSGLPPHLQRSTKKRTVDARQDVLNVLGELEHELASGELLNRYRRIGHDAMEEELKHANISVRAGRGPNFLNGKSHKGGTKIEVEEFTADLLKQLKLASPESQSEEQQIADLKDQLKALEGRIHRIWDHAHVWAIQLREARAEIRALKKAMKPKVV